MTKLRMRINLYGVTSTAAGKEYSNIQRGDIVEADSRTTAQFLAAGYAERKLDGPIGLPGKPDI